MKRKCLIKWMIVVCLVLTFTNCKDIEGYLDKNPTGGLSDVQLFQNYAQLDGFIMNLYSRLPYEWFVGPSNTSLQATFTNASASDEGITSLNFDGNSPHHFTSNPITPTSNMLDTWVENYAAIRGTNIFLNGIVDYTPIAPNEIKGKDLLIAEARFLRAWFHFELFKRYGGVPIVDRVLKVTDELNLPRNSARETVDFIVSDCEFAAETLPLIQNASEKGRATKGAAMTLKAKVLLYMASKLHNPTNDAQLWANAASAYKDVMELNHYSVGTNYARLFNERNTANIIFQSTRNNTNWIFANYPPSLGGSGRGVNPSQQMVDSYEMQATGLRIDEPGSGYDPSNPYVGRDPRFYHSIVYHGAYVGPSNAQIHTSVGWASDGIIPEGNTIRTQTGYYLKKTVDQTGREQPNKVPGNHFWVYMRYEDVLLSYAEAQNEALSSPDASVYEAVNEVRTRSSVNMPALPANLTKEKMRERIRAERRVELAFEGQRFWDIRRWRIANDVMHELWGMSITLNGPVTSYMPIKVADRVYEPHFDLFPIPQSEINKQNALKQNSDYEE